MSFLISQKGGGEGGGALAFLYWKEISPNTLFPKNNKHTHSYPSLCIKKRNDQTWKDIYVKISAYFFASFLFYFFLPQKKLNNS